MALALKLAPRRAKDGELRSIPAEPGVLFGRCFRGTFARLCLIPRAMLTGQCLLSSTRCYLVSIFRWIILLIAFREIPFFQFEMTLCLLCVDTPLNNLRVVCVFRWSMFCFLRTRFPFMCESFLAVGFLAACGYLYLVACVVYPCSFCPLCLQGFRRLVFLVWLLGDTCAAFEN